MPFSKDIPRGENLPPKHPNRPEHGVIDAAGFEELHGRPTGARSPEGAPADPEADHRQVWGLMAGAVVAVILLAVAVYIFLGPWLALVALVFGMGLAVVANPVFWAARLRGEERQ